jgi:hypothetical protein
MNFFSIFGPNVYSNEQEMTTSTNQVNPSEVVSNIFSTEIQELLQPILSENINNNRSSSGTQTTETQTTDDNTRTEEIFYFENLNPTSPQLSLSELNEATTLEIKTEEEETICVICHNNIEQNTIYRKINNCQHCFHVKCIDEWLNQSTTCPTCRIELSERRQQSTSSRVRRNGTTSFSFPLYSFRYT